MKIYQIHKYGGDWEDYYDCIMASYLSKEKAVEEKKRLEKEEVIATKCNSCPLYYCPMECDLQCGTEECLLHAIERAKDYCDAYAVIEVDKCANYKHKIDECSYKVIEVEVIE